MKAHSPLRRRCLVSLCGAAAGFGAGTVQAASALLQVSATIQRRASVRVTRIPASFVTTREDLADGWSRVRDSVILQVRANHEDGLLLQVGPLLGTVSGAEISGFARTVAVGPEGAVVDLPTLRGEAYVELGFRFRLAPGTQAGVHPWPLELGAAT